MVLLEDYTKEDCQKIFTDMLDQFSDSWEMDDIFDRSSIDPKLHWLNSNNRKVLGLCRKIRTGRKYNGVTDEMEDVFRYEIYLNPNCMKFDENAIKIIKETLAHEICHTMPDCMNHGIQFHANGKRIFDEFGYKIDTRADVDASNYFRSVLPDHPYKLQCADCGKEYYQDRLSDSIKNPGAYHCGRCSGNLDSYKLNKQTGEYELYKAHDAERDYKYFAACPYSECDFIQGFKTRNKKFTDLIYLLNRGIPLKCPKCKRDGIYVSDNGKLISADTDIDSYSVGDTLFTRTHSA